MNIQQLIKECYQAAIDRGEYDCPECEGKKTINNGDSEEPDIIYCPDCNGTGIDPDKDINELLALINLGLYRALDAYRVNKFIKFGDCTICFNRIRDNLDFKAYYTEYLINTYESYLASTFIKIFELCGYLKTGLLVNSHKSYCEKSKLWLSNIHADLRLINTYINNKDFSFAMSCLFGFCKHHNIDIETHIKLKMEYNRVKNKGKRKNITIS